MKHLLSLSFAFMVCSAIMAQTSDVVSRLEQLEKRISVLEQKIKDPASASTSKTNLVNNIASKPSQTTVKSKSGIEYALTSAVGDNESGYITINISATNLAKDDINVLFMGLPTLVYEDGSSYTDETGFPKVTFGSSTWGLISATLIPEVSTTLKIQLADPGNHQLIKVLDFKTKPGNNDGFRFTNIPIKWE